MNYLVITLIEGTIFGIPTTLFDFSIFRLIMNYIRINFIQPKFTIRNNNKFKSKEKERKGKILKLIKLIII
jgi:hypothetical protein